MGESSDSKMTCGECGEVVRDEDTFCANCGAIFREGVVCSHHSAVGAEGVCVICSQPFCRQCGGLVNKVFFCDPHSAYEVVEGMVRVFGDTDNLQAQYVTRCLEQAGFHPFLYSRHINPGADIARWIPLRNFGRHTIIELKVLVPFREVLESEGVLQKLHLTSP